MTRTQETVLQAAVVVAGVVLLIVFEPSATVAWIAAAVVLGIGLVTLAAGPGEPFRSRVIRIELLSIVVMVAAVLVVTFAIDGGADWQYGGYLALLLSAALAASWIVGRRERAAD